MLSKDILIINRLGLHARAAAKLAKTAGQFGASTHVSTEKSSADAKSVMSLMLLAAIRGTSLKVTTDGKDELEAMEAIESLINDRFGEEE